MSENSAMPTTSGVALCPRCGQVVGTWHTKPQCDAAYDRAYRAATLASAAEALDPRWEGVLTDAEADEMTLVLAKRHKCLDHSGPNSGPCRTDRERMALLRPLIDAAIAARGLA